MIIAPLKNKIVPYNNYTMGFKKEDVKSAVEFYRKYMDECYKLKKDFPKIWGVIENIIGNIEDTENDVETWYDNYNRLLLTEAFEDVTK